MSVESVVINVGFLAYGTSKDVTFVRVEFHLPLVLPLGRLILCFLYLGAGLLYPYSEVLFASNGALTSRQNRTFNHQNAFQLTAKIKTSPDLDHSLFVMCDIKGCQENVFLS